LTTRSGLPQKGQAIEIEIETMSHYVLSEMLSQRRKVHSPGKNGVARIAAWSYSIKQ